MNRGAWGNRDRRRRWPYMPQSTGRCQRRADRQWPANLRHTRSLSWRMRRHFADHRLHYGLGRNRLTLGRGRRSRWSGHAVRFRHFRGVIVVFFFAARWMHVTLDV